MYERQHYLRGSEQELFSQTWRKSAVGAQIVRGRRTFLHEFLIGAEILEVQQFCWRRDFTRRGDFNVCLSSIIYCQAHGFDIPQKFSSEVFRNSFLQKFSQ
jgi:hypothetical protein